MTSTVKHVLIGAVGALLLLLLVGLAVILSGGYDVAATERHTSLGAWALDTNFRNSIQGHAEDVTAPELTPAMVSAGAPEYKAMCAHCHGGVGESRAEWAEGMRPKPPALAAAAREWSAAEIFWLVKHGAKMTGMPAFGPTHEDRKIWHIAAFVKAMPEMTRDQYAGYRAEHGEDAHSHAGDGGASAPEH
ncbi:c-type cytochrome [Sphingosinicella rhizophila]|uniref:Cytochrome c n=1 Tax=Sphingosinicella rhizophila TaxID=3050082 RepID=A0ABU3QA87_9SPHN|nr:cytochrome c [Sphingosinicella sp. GR2756]MDT9600237.1 cytochrome c [Sphingosinicella sp. GR2756]